MFRIFIHSKWCKGCGICADFCPKKVFDFTMGSAPVPVRVESCIGCRKCELICPDLAIKVDKVEAELK